MKILASSSFSLQDPAATMPLVWVGGSVGGFSDRLSTAACGRTEYAAVHSWEEVVWVSKFARKQLCKSESKTTFHSTIQTSRTCFFFVLFVKTFTVLECHCCELEPAPLTHEPQAEDWRAGPQGAAGPAYPLPGTRAPGAPLWSWTCWLGTRT